MIDQAVEVQEVAEAEVPSGDVLRRVGSPAELDLAPYAQPRGKSLIEVAAGRAAAMLPHPRPAREESPPIALVGIGLVIGVAAGLLII